MIMRTRFVDALLKEISPYTPLFLTKWCLKRLHLGSLLNFPVIEMEINKRLDKKLTNILRLYKETGLTDQEIYRSVYVELSRYNLMCMGIEHYIEKQIHHRPLTIVK
jgi:hypothetical protein